MNNDLISRSALKKAFKAWKTMDDYYHNTDCNDIPFSEAFDLIDNASPVNLEKCSFIEGYKEDCEKGKKCYERQQGEWIYGEDDYGQDGWFCSECNFFVPWYYEYYEKDINFIREYKACPHCLAEIVSYTGKDREKKGDEK